MTRVSGNVQFVSEKNVLIASRHANNSIKVTLMVLLLLSVFFQQMPRVCDKKPARTTIAMHATAG